MAAIGTRAFELVALANLFGDPRGRDFVTEMFPPSVVEIYDVALADARWAGADLTERALILADLLARDESLAARYQADVDAGRLGFGAGDDPAVEDAIDRVARTLEPMAESIGPDDDDTGVDGGDDGLLDGAPAEPWSPLPPTPGEKSDSAPAATVSTWLNAEVEGADDRPLEASKRYTLAVSFGAQLDASADPAVPVASEPASLHFAAGVESLEVMVRLASSDFDVPPDALPLRVGRDGVSLRRALFDISPLHDGRSVLSVLVDVAGNFLQRVDLTFDVGARPGASAANYGRPIGAAQVLGERSAGLQFMPAVGGYQLIATAVSPHPIEIRITPDELAARIEAVREVLLATVKKRQIALEMDIADDDAATFLQELAFAGFRLFQSIFAGPGASPDLRAVGAWLRQSLSGDTATLQVVSTGFPVPWALMYLTERFDPASLRWEDFIGMRHVIEQIPMTEITAVPPSPMIVSTPELRVRALFNASIDDTMPSRPVAEQRRYWGSRGVTLTEGTQVDDLVRSALVPGAADQVLYLYCHAESSLRDTDDSTLIFTGGTGVSLGQLSVFAPIEDVLDSHPLVFINACESGELTPNFYDGFVPYFLAKGARGVIGTECKTPGLFASEWAKAFFDQLFAGESLGHIVLALRRRFLAEHNNALGLLYGVHCDADTVVAPALGAPA